MPAQKRSHETSPSHSPQPDEMDGDDLQQQLEQNNLSEAAEETSDSDGSDSSSDGEKNEFVAVKLSDIRKEVQCPICLGIIRKTRTVMECLHRFCRECIDKSMRLGNNECPACRTHCASRRSLRDDPTYDALIAILYPDIDKYEEEELAFHEDEKVRNKQIQASIAETLRRQSEALGRKKTGKATATAPAYLRRSQGNNYRHVRGRRALRTPEHEGSNDEDDVSGNDNGKDSSSSGDEHSPEVKPKRFKRWGVGGKDTDTTRESLGAAAGLVGIPEILSWGKGGMRSNSRHGGLGSGNGKSVKNSRLSSIMDSLRRSDSDKDVLDISLELVSLQGDKIPSLQRPYLRCSPSLSIGQLCNYVAVEASTEADQIQLWAMKNVQKETKGSSILEGCESYSSPPVLDPSKYEACLLEEHQTLDELYSTFSPGQPNLLLGYGNK